MHVYRGMICLARGGVAEARKQYNTAALIDPQRDSSPPGSLLTAVVLAEVSYLSGELDKAREILDRHEGTVAGINEWFDVFIVRNVVSVGIDMVSGDPEAALRRIHCVERSVRARGLVLRERVLRCLEIGLRMRMGDLNVLSQPEFEPGIWRGTEQREGQTLPWRARALFALCEASYLRANGRHEDALAILTEVESLLVADGILIMQPTLWFVRAAIFADANNESGAFQAREMANRFTERFGVVFGYLGGIYETGASGVEARDATRFDMASMYVNAAEAKIGFPSNPGGDLQMLLSHRDLEVLRKLMHGLPNKGIARALGISEHTVKQHLKRIYSKIGARNRVQAVERARVGKLNP